MKDDEVQFYSILSNKVWGTTPNIFFAQQMNVSISLPALLSLSLFIVWVSGKYGGDDGDFYVRPKVPLCHKIAGTWSVLLKSTNNTKSPSNTGRFVITGHCCAIFYTALDIGAAAFGDPPALNPFLERMACYHVPNDALDVEYFPGGVDFELEYMVGSGFTEDSKSGYNPFYCTVRDDDEIFCTSPVFEAVLLKKNDDVDEDITEWYNTEPGGGAGKGYTFDTTACVTCANAQN